MEEDTLQTKPLTESITLLMQRQAEAEEEELLQPKSKAGGTPRMTAAVADQIGALEGSGQPLPASERIYFEPRFGADFGQIRIHTGAEAVASAQAVNARAYTLGRNIVFARNQFAPGAHEGKRLIAHELAHVVQQNTGGKLQVQRQVHLGVSTTEGQFLPAPKPEDPAFGSAQPDCSTPAKDVYELHGTITSTNPACSVAGVKNRRKDDPMLKVVRADYRLAGKDPCPGFPGIPDLDFWIADQWRVVAIDRFRMTVMNMCGDEEQLTVTGRILGHQEIVKSMPPTAPNPPPEQTVDVELRTSIMKCAKVSFDKECNKVTCIPSDQTKTPRVFLWNASINEYVDTDDETYTKTAGNLATLMGIITKEYEDGEWRSNRCGDARW